MNHQPISTLLYCLFLPTITSALAESSKDHATTFKRHTQAGWLKDINRQTEAITRDPQAVTGDMPWLIPEKPFDIRQKEKLESCYHREDFEGLQTFGEQRAKQLASEQSPEGEAWRLLNKSPDCYCPDANEHTLLQPMEQILKALQHPNTWSQQKHWPVDTQGMPVYNQNTEMSATIALLRRHFTGCDHRKKLVLKNEQQLHSPDIRECTHTIISDQGGCAKFANNPDCEFLNSECLGSSPSSGTCVTYQDRYDCGYTGSLSLIGLAESIECEGQPMPCMLGECQADITDADNGDFTSAIAGLHAAKHMTSDLYYKQNGIGCRIFEGKPCKCKQGMFHMVDCCNLPTHVNFGSYMNLLLMGYLFDKSAMHLQSDAPNQLTGQYQKMREPLLHGVNKLSEPAQHFRSQATESWDKLSAKLWPTPAEVHTQTATARPVAGELSQQAQQAVLSDM